MRHEHLWSIGRVAVLVAFFASVPMPAQSVLDLRVGRHWAGHDLTVNHLDPATLGTLANVTGVPMGIETYSTNLLEPVGRSVTISGRTLREGLDALATIDPRYEWREDNGVIVFRHAESWRQPDHVLDKVVPPISVLRSRSEKALDLACSVVAGDRRSIKYHYDPPDTKVFAIQTREGDTILRLLNAIVREHGTMVWGYGPEPTGGIRVSLYNGFGGGACALAAAAGPMAPLDVEAFNIPDTDNRNLLDRVVGGRADGSPVTVFTMLGEPASLAGVPIGFEADPETPRNGPAFVNVIATGLLLRDALNAMRLLDRRYEWREINRTIVIRPIEAWNDRKHPLNAKVRNVRLVNVPVGEALSQTVRLLGNRKEPAAFFLDTRTVSVDVLDGTILDVITAIAAGADLSWTYRRADSYSSHLTGLDHVLQLQLRGAGIGIPVR
jgi:hypothetical protein